MKTFRGRLGAIGLAAVTIASAGLLVAACGTSGGAPGATVTVTPPPVTKTVSPSPTMPTGPAQCTTSDLRLTVGQENGAAGTIYYPLDFTNVSSSACTIYGYPGVSFATSAGGSIIGAPAGRRDISGITPTLITVQPGGTAHAILALSDVLVSNQCHQNQTPVNTVQVYPPDQYTALFAPIKATGCTMKSLVVMWVSPVTSGS